MAHHGKAYGLSAEIQKKLAASYDPELESQAITWLEALTGSAVDEFDSLKDGMILCKAMNVLQPGAIKKINESKMPFKQMENIGNFLTSAQSYGVAVNDLFQTVDLYESKNKNAVIDGIIALGRAAQRNGFEGPVIGPKESHATPREFDEAKLRAGETIIGGQAGETRVMVIVCTL